MIKTTNSEREREYECCIIMISYLAQLAIYVLGFSLAVWFGLRLELIWRGSNFIATQAI